MTPGVIKRSASGSQAPLCAAIGALRPGRVTFKGRSEGPVRLAVPDELERRIKSVAQFLLAQRTGSKWCKAAGIHVAVCRNVGQAVGTTTALPGLGAIADCTPTQVRNRFG